MLLFQYCFLPILTILKHYSIYDIFTLLIFLSCDTIQSTIFPFSIFSTVIFTTLKFLQLLFLTALFCDTLKLPEIKNLLHELIYDYISCTFKWVHTDTIIIC